MKTTTTMDTLRKDRGLSVGLRGPKRRCKSVDAISYPHSRSVDTPDRDAEGNANSDASVGTARPWDASDAGNATFAGAGSGGSIGSRGGGDGIRAMLAILVTPRMSERLQVPSVQLHMRRRHVSRPRGCIGKLRTLAQTRIGAANEGVAKGSTSAAGVSSKRKPGEERIRGPSGVGCGSSPAKLLPGPFPSSPRPLPACSPRGPCRG